MNSVFLSVIIPTLNEEKYIGRLLVDLVKQTDKDFEVIVVDGGSQDKTERIVNKFLKKLPLRFLKQEGGVSKQRNKGAQVASGKFLVFFDADVQISPKYFENLKKQIQKFTSEVFTTYVKPDSRDAYDKLISRLFNRVYDVSVVIDRPFIAGFNFIVSKTAFEKVNGFDFQVAHGEDYDLSYRLFQAGYPTVVLKTPLITFSLRRYRQEGRLNVLRKNAQAGLHALTRGKIKKDLFSYPMGGAWYRKIKKTKSNSKLRIRLEKYLKRSINFFLE